RGHPRHPRRVPRPAARGPGEHVPHPAPAGSPARRRRSRTDAVCGTGARLAPRARPGRGDPRTRRGRRHHTDRQRLVRRRRADRRPLVRRRRRLVRRRDMMTFRYHIVTIVSVFLALAIGIAIGGGPLKGEVDNSLVTQVENDRRTIAALEGQLAGAETASEFNDAVATTLAPRVLRDQLAGHGVAVVSLPGADPATVAALGERVTDAGGEVVGNYRIAAGLLDAEQQPLVEDLAGRLVGGAPDLAPLADASGYEQAGALVARAIATAEDTPAEVAGPASACLAGLSTAGLFTAGGTPTARGDLVLVVAGPTVMENLPDGAGAGLAALADAVSEGAGGVVV